MGQIGESSLYILLDNYTVTLRKFVTYSKNTHFKPTGEKNKTALNGINLKIYYIRKMKIFGLLML